jgi:hypothetical protein
MQNVLYSVCQGSIGMSRYKCKFVYGCPVYFSYP